MVAAIGFAAGIAAVWIERSQQIGAVVVHSSRTHPAAALVIVPGAALVNAGSEELVWRWMLWDASCPRAAAAFCALSFSVAHITAGVPSGPLGVAAVFAFGLVVGQIRGRFGLLAAIVCHFAADLPILLHLLD